MALFIKGMGNISPQNTWNASALPEDINRPSSDRFTAVEPDYTQFIDPKNIRRMSRIIRLGVSSAAIALRQARLTAPDAIVTGTGYGCLEDTGTFLSKMIENREEALNPTPFIQSTHNTIGSQIALLLQTQGYNQTYAHGAFSFENALLDAMIQSEENSRKNILIGGVDEVTNISHTIQQRFGMFRKTVNGEGAVFFVANGEAQNGLARVNAVSTLYKPDARELAIYVNSFDGQYDLVLLGTSNADEAGDLKQTARNFPATGLFKHLSGENPVASSFGMWLAVTILTTQQVPQAVLLSGNPTSVKNILVLNRYFGTHYSAISLSAC